MTAVWGQISAGAILAFVAYMYFTGRIVPQRLYKDMERQRDFWEAEYCKVRDLYFERKDATLESNTEALRLAQQSFDSLSKQRKAS